MLSVIFERQLYALRYGRRTVSCSTRSIHKRIVQKSQLQVPPFLNKGNNCTVNRIRTMVTITQTIGKSDTNSVTKESTISQIDQRLSHPNDNSSPPSHQPQQLSLNEELSVIVTDACYQRIHYLIAQKKKKNSESNTEENHENYFLRVFVDAGGCSGFTYQFELDTDTNLNPNEDIVFTESSLSLSSSPVTTSAATPARVVIDRGSLLLLKGSTIDYVQEMIKSTFEVRDNPQSESACGCGSSFAVKNFTSNPAID